ncbi:hypothetical protein BST61_g6253 [Cercospora zeina]
MRHLITTPLAPRPKRHRDHTIIPPSGPLPLLPISDDDSPLSHGSRVPLLQTPLQVQVGKRQTSLSLYHLPESHHDDDDAKPDPKNSQLSLIILTFTVTMDPDLISTGSRNQIYGYSFCTARLMPSHHHHHQFWPMYHGAPCEVLII